MGDRQTNRPSQREREMLVSWCFESRGETDRQTDRDTETERETEREGERWRERAFCCSCLHLTKHCSQNVLARLPSLQIINNAAIRGRERETERETNRERETGTKTETER